MHPTKTSNCLILPWQRSITPISIQMSRLASSLRRFRTRTRLSLTIKRSSFTISSKALAKVVVEMAAPLETITPTRNGEPIVPFSQMMKRTVKMSIMIFIGVTEAVSAPCLASKGANGSSRRLEKNSGRRQIGRPRIKVKNSIANKSSTNSMSSLISRDKQKRKILRETIREVQIIRQKLKSTS